MNKSLHRVLVATAVAVFAWACSGCKAPTKLPIHQSQGFDPLAISTITVLLIVDLRPDKVRMSDFNRVIQKQARAVLKSKRYPVEVLEESAQVANLTEEDLEAASAEWIRSLQPAGAPWIMVFAVHDVTRRLTFGSTGNAEISAYLYDREKAALVWHDKGLGQAGQGGLLGMALINLMDESALQMATGNALMSLPKRPKK